MPDQIGNINVPDPGVSGVFPLQPLFGYGRTHAPQVVVHQFGSGNRKIEQRFLLGNGARQITLQFPELSDAKRQALRNFWEARKGPYQPFTFNYPNEDQSGTTALRMRFLDAPLSWQYLADQITSVGVTLVEDADPSAAPTYTVSSTVTRFPSATLSSGLLSQVQQLVPLVKITVKEPGYPAIYVSDRRCTVGSQLYQARLLTWEGIGQSMNGESDTARFVFGNADRVMRDLSGDTDLYRAAVQFALLHVGTGIKLDLWAGEVRSWTGGEGIEFSLECSDSLFELGLDYPARKIDRTCWKEFNDGAACPYASVNPGGSFTTCDKSWTACQARGMSDYFGGIVAKPQGVTTLDNTTGTWGIGRRLLTSFSLVSDSVYGAPLTEIYTDDKMPVNCLIVAGRDEGDFYSALGIVGAGPLTAYDTSAAAHQLDGQPAHGPLSGASGYGLRRSLGHDPVQANDPDADSDEFSLSAVGGGFSGERAAGVAFVEIRRTDAKGLQLSQITQHQMVASVQGGLGGWYWSDASTRVWGSNITNPIWIAVNMILRAKGLQTASASSQVAVFDVQSAISAAAVCASTATSLIDGGSETQYKFRGVIAQTKPLRDWLQEVLNNCLGYWVNSAGKIKFGLRNDSSALSAFTTGNIVLGSLRLSAIAPAFNDLTATFADAEFKYATNNVRIYDETHRKRYGRTSATINLVGTAWKSQAGRIATTRLREELGGITLAEWRAARQGSFKTTVLALDVEPGMVCSLTHEDMPGGAGEFRIQRWRLNPDYSIDIEWRTTTDSMYDLTVGFKPQDIAADPVPAEALVDLVPPNPYSVTAELLGTDGLNATIAISFVPQTPAGTFTGCQVSVDTGDGILSIGPYDSTSGIITVPCPLDAPASYKVLFQPRSRVYTVPLSLSTPYDTVTVPARTYIPAGARPGSGDWSVAVSNYTLDPASKVKYANITITVTHASADASIYKAYMYRGDPKSTVPSDYAFIATAWKSATPFTFGKADEPCQAGDVDYWVVLLPATQNAEMPVDSTAIAGAKKVTLQGYALPANATSYTLYINTDDGLGYGYQDGVLVTRSSPISPGHIMGSYSVAITLPADLARRYYQVQRRKASNSLYDSTTTYTSWEEIFGGSINDPSAHSEKRVGDWWDMPVAEYGQFRLAIFGFTDYAVTYSNLQNYSLTAGGLFKLSAADPSTVGPGLALRGTQLGTASDDSSNIITNGSFESGFKDWTAATGWAINTTNSTSGQNCAYTEGFTSGERRLTSGIFIPCLPGEKYYMQASMAIEDTVGSGYDVWVDFFKRDGSLVSGGPYGNLAMYPVAAGTWSKRSSTFTVPSDALTFVVVARVTGAAGRGRAYLDNVIVRRMIDTPQIAPGAVVPSLLPAGFSMNGLGSALPSLPNSSYPVGAFFVNTSDNLPYKNEAGAWEPVLKPERLANGAMNPGVTLVADQMISGSIAAGIAYLGKILVSQLLADTAVFTNDVVFKRSGSNTQVLINSTNVATVNGSGLGVAIGSTNTVVNTPMILFQALKMFSGFGYTVTIDIDGSGTFNGEVSANGLNSSSGEVKVSGTKVLGARRTGWTSPSGTAARTTYNTATVTVEDLAERVKALIDDLTAHGVIGS